MAKTKITVDTLSRGTIQNIMYGNTLTHITTVGYNDHVTRDVKFSLLLHTKEEVVEKIGRILAEEAKYGNLITVHYLKDGDKVEGVDPKMIYGPWGFTGSDLATLGGA